MLTITISGAQGAGKTSLLKLINNALLREGHGSLLRLLNESTAECAVVQLDDPVDLAKSLSQLSLPERR